METQKVNFSMMVNSADCKHMIFRALNDKEHSKRFVTAITSAVAVNPALEKCEVKSVISAALLGESLKLSPSPQLGQYYMVPFEQKEKYDKDTGLTTPASTVAVFVLGYKGYIQLAIRSGQYRRIDTLVVKKGELESYNPLTGEIKVNLIEDEIAREAAPTIGYYAAFEYLNGFVKSMYWSREKMLAHAQRYSKAFGPAPAKGKHPGRVSFDDYLAGKYDKKNEWAYSSFWYRDFDSMGIKTMLRQLISKWGVMSIDMCNAVERDETAVTYTKDGELAPYAETPTQTPTVYVDAETGEVTDEEPTDDPPASDPPTVSINDL